MISDKSCPNHNQKMQQNSRKDHHFRAEKETETIAKDPITRAHVASRVLRQAFPQGFSFASSFDDQNDFESVILRQFINLAYTPVYKSLNEIKSGKILSLFSQTFTVAAPWYSLQKRY
ncbi:hypothetical protein E2986_13344 [Frieseomelitta varia]|uniref:Uncharacterized protein n=1 Tax=Frieseomelitta varia TaxID=561572 RepID=A0A833S429_9HYME|nr:hypothetical protein E2986_13344 [Frieseomelitta varia]